MLSLPPTQSLMREYTGDEGMLMALTLFLTLRLACNVHCLKNLTFLFHSGHLQNGWRVVVLELFI